MAQDQLDQQLASASRPPRKVIVAYIPPVISTLVGVPGFSGWTAHRGHRSDVVEDLLDRGLAVLSRGDKIDHRRES